MGFLKSMKCLSGLLRVSKYLYYIKKLLNIAIFATLFKAVSGEVLSSDKKEYKKLISNRRSIF